MTCCWAEQHCNLRAAMANGQSNTHSPQAEFASLAYQLYLLPSHALQVQQAMCACFWPPSCRTVASQHAVPNNSNSAQPCSTCTLASNSSKAAKDVDGAPAVHTAVQQQWAGGWQECEGAR
jgi:hypothetical protein